MFVEFEMAAGGKVSFNVYEIACVEEFCTIPDTSQLGNFCEVHLTTAKSNIVNGTFQEVMGKIEKMRMRTPALAFGRN